jgi:hypothetical protein
MASDDSRLLNKKTGGGGEYPHCTTRTVQKVDYHGECDIVSVQSPTMAIGLGVRVHLRASRSNNDSRIELNAGQIGSGALEFVNDQDHSALNGTSIDKTTRPASRGAQVEEGQGDSPERHDPILD